MNKMQILFVMIVMLTITAVLVAPAAAQATCDEDEFALASGNGTVICLTAEQINTALQSDTSSNTGSATAAGRPSFGTTDDALKAEITALFDGVVYTSTPAASDGCYATMIEYVEDGSDLHRIRATINRSEITEDRFLSLPPEGELHEDWPAWFGLHDIHTDRPTQCGEIMWDIATKALFTASEETFVEYTFTLDRATLNELANEPYYAAASGQQNTLGLFLGSQRGIEVMVNDEAYFVRGNFCHDCVNGTIVSDSADDDEMAASDLGHFGDSDREAPTDELIVVPIPLEFEGQYVIRMHLDAGDDVVLWFGVANPGTTAELEEQGAAIVNNVASLSGTGSTATSTPRQ